MIKFVDISKTFTVKKQKVQALSHISLEINKGDIFGVIGFSGAGKSTLLRMVNALEKPSTGQVLVNGEDINTLNITRLRQVRKQIGMIFQQFNLLNSKTVYDNVAIPLVLNKMAPEEIHKRVLELLQFVELSDKTAAFLNQLSGGQKQRVGIARALATNPSILLCDEATSALDPETTEAILKLLEKINKELKITILVVTHEIHVIQRLCNKVAVMEKGKLVETGSVLDVFGNPQQDMTKRFVRTVIPDTIPPSIVAALHKEKKPFKLLKIHFLGEKAKDNVLYHINRFLEVETSVMFASVTELQKTVLGIFVIQVMGKAEDFTKVTNYLDEQQLPWEEVSI